MSPQNSLPRDDEIEVSVFGPGYGESLLIHAGNGCWIAVDSCIDHASRRPRPLRYLEELGVNANTAIHIVVASHWHDDHVRGMHELFKAASSAYFICSTALTSVEFLALADPRERFKSYDAGATRTLPLPDRDSRAWKVEVGNRRPCLVGSGYHNQCKADCTVAF